MANGADAADEGAAEGEGAGVDAVVTETKKVMVVVSIL